MQSPSKSNVLRQPGQGSHPPSTRFLLSGIWAHLSRRRRIQLGLLLVVMLVSGVAELLSLGAVLPFLLVLSDPERLWQQPLVQSLAAQLGIIQASQLLLPATLVFVIAAVVAAFIRLANLWLNGRLAAAVGSDLSCEAYRRTLYQPYEVHVQRNSSEVVMAATTQIGQTVSALNVLLRPLPLWWPQVYLQVCWWMQWWLWLQLPYLVVYTECWRLPPAVSSVATAKKFRVQRSAAQSTAGRTWCHS